MKFVYFVFLLLLTWSRALAATGDLETKLLSDSVLVGETTEMLIRIEGTDRALIGQIPQVAGLSLDLKATTAPVRGGVRDTLFRLAVRPLREGVLRIPPIPVKVLGKTLESSAAEIESLSPDTLTWSQQQIQELDLQYATRWSLPKRQLYAGESVPVKLHVYLPALAGSPELAFPRDRSTGLAVTPLLPVDPYKPENQAIGQTLLRGTNYQVFVFAARASAIAGGKLSLGPAIAPAIIKVRRQEGIQIREFSLEADLKIPATELTGLAFPMAAPANFSGAIGEFELLAELQANQLTPRAPLEVTISASGTGNFADLPSPSLTSQGDWKIVSVRRLGSADSSWRGPARFQYLLTHPATPASLPPFEVVSFSPESKQFLTARTPAIPLQWSGLVDPENPITSAPIDPGNSTANSDPFAPIRERSNAPVLALTPSPPFWWSPVVGIAALLPLLVLLYQGHLKRQAERFPQSKLIDELKKIPVSTSSDDFLRRAGSLIESQLAESDRPEIAKKILKLRDENCFSAEASKLEIPSRKRKEWINALRQALMGLMVLLCLGLSESEAATPSELSPRTSDELVNSGSEFATRGEWAAAAKAFRQALATDPRNREARTRLDLVHQSASSSLPKPNLWRDSIAHFKRTSLQQIATVAAILCLYALALASNYRQHRKSWLSLGIALGTFSALSFWSSQNYPSLRSTSDLQSLAVLRSDTPLHQAPLASSPASFLPAATPAAIIAERGEWLRIETATTDGTSAYWVKNSDLLLLSTPIEK